MSDLATGSGASILVGPPFSPPVSHAKVIGSNLATSPGAAASSIPRGNSPPVNLHRLAQSPQTSVATNLTVESVPSSVNTHLTINSGLTNASAGTHKSTSSSGSKSVTASSVGGGSLTRSVGNTLVPPMPAAQQPQAPAPPPAASLAPKLQKGDRLVWTKGRMLGRGALGTVFLGLESTSGHLVAVKELLFEDGDPNLEERLGSLQVELKILKRLEHPHIVGYYSAARQGSAFYIFMEYVAGGSLASLVQQFGPLSSALAANFGFQILLGLQYLHANSVVHSDIKCANVLITVDAIAKLADFGSAHLLTEPNPRKLGEAGTAFWMSPEAIRGQALRPAADVWSFGCTMMELLLGEVPFSFVGNAFAVMSYVADEDGGPIQLPHHLRPILTDDGLDLVLQCLHRVPERRPTVVELMHHPFFARFNSMIPSTTSLLGSSRSPQPTRPSSARSAVSEALSLDATQQTTMTTLPEVWNHVAASEASASMASTRTSIASGAVNPVKDHLIQQAFRVVSSSPEPRSAVTPMVSTPPLGAAQTSVTSGPLGAEGEGNTAFNSMSSLDTISLSDLSSRTSQQGQSQSHNKSITASTVGTPTANDVAARIGVVMQTYLATGGKSAEGTAWTSPNAATSASSLTGATGGGGGGAFETSVLGSATGAASNTSIPMVRRLSTDSGNSLVAHGPPPTTVAGEAPLSVPANGEELPRPIGEFGQGGPQAMYFVYDEEEEAEEDENITVAEMLARVRAERQAKKGGSFWSNCCNGSDTADQAAVLMPSPFVPPSASQRGSPPSDTMTGGDPSMSEEGSPSERQRSSLGAELQRQDAQYYAPQRRQGSRFQAILLVATSLFAIGAVILVVVFTVLK